MPLLSGGGTSASRPYLPRLADRLLDDRLHAIGAVLIEGVKGCGKTATARQRAASEVLLDTDPEAERRAALDPRLLLEARRPAFSTSGNGPRGSGTPSDARWTIAGCPASSF